MYSCSIVPTPQQVSYLVLPDSEEAKDLTVYFVPRLSADLPVKWSLMVYATATRGAGKVALHPPTGDLPYFTSYLVCKKYELCCRGTEYAAVYNTLH